MKKLFQDRIALVTGASRGIGAAAALALAAEGAHILAVARTVGALEELDDQIQEQGGSATLVPLDLMTYDAIDRLGANIYERWGRLDILIGAAASLGQLSPVGHIDPDVWNQTLGLNVTANWRLLRACDPLLRQSEAGRAIFLTSGITKHFPAYWSLYSASKAALEGLVVSYAREVEKSQVRVNLINPGPTRTALRAAAFPGEDSSTLPPPTHVTPTILKLAAPEFTGNGLWVAADTPSQSVGATTPSTPNLIH